MNLKTIRSTAIAATVVLAGSLAAPAVWAQSDVEDNVQRAAEMSEMGKGKARDAKEKAKEARNKGNDKAENMRERADADVEDARNRADDEAEQARERAEAAQERGESEREQAQATAANRDNANRKADPASKGSEQGQVKKQENAKAWWNIWD